MTFKHKQQISNRTNRFEQKNETKQHYKGKNQKQQKRLEKPYKIKEIQAFITGCAVIVKRGNIYKMLLIYYLKLQ